MSDRSTFTGAWRNAAAGVSDAGPTHTVDPAHGDRDPATGRDTGEAIPGFDPAAGDDIAGYHPAPITADGTRLDSTDYDSHDATTADRGAVAERFRADRPFTFDGDEYRVRYEDPIALVNRTISDAALRRGLNGDPINNPNPRQPAPEAIWSVVRRRVLGYRTHQLRDVTDNTATVVTGGGRAADGVLTGAERGLPRLLARPAQRRSPEPLSDSITIDQGTYSPASSVVDAAGVY